MVSEWLHEKYSCKCHLHISGNTLGQLWDKIRNNGIWETRKIKLLVVTIDGESKFDKHLRDVCLKANKVIHIYENKKVLTF